MRITLRFTKKISSTIKLPLRKIYAKYVSVSCASFGEKLRVNGYSVVTKHTYLGRNVSFNGMRIQGNGKVVIGDYFHSGEGCLILTSNHNYEGDAIPYDKTTINKDVKIGDFVWLGSRVLILGGVEIGEGAIIQAGSVVVTDIPSCAIAGGSPAKVFKYRDKEHFNNLKEEGKYF